MKKQMLMLAAVAAVGTLAVGCISLDNLTRKPQVPVYTETTTTVTETNGAQTVTETKTLEALLDGGWDLFLFRSGYDTSFGNASGGYGPSSNRFDFAINDYKNMTTTNAAPNIKATGDALGNVIGSATAAAATVK